MQKVLFFSVVLKERIWGGHNLAKRYDSTSKELLGEAWILSGHNEGETIVTNGEYQSKGLNDLYLNNKVLFGNSHYNKFPLLIKILDAQNYLSVQVHPNDNYALKHHNDYGKNECWYILDAKPDARIIYGLKTINKDDFKKAIDDQKWDDALNYIPVKKDDFFDVPVGTVHAIGAGIEILEIQQSSDVTYRLYDFDRVDSHGNKRQLHIEQSLEVIDYSIREPKLNKKQYKSVERLVSNTYFTVDKLNFKEEVLIHNNDLYMILFAKDKDAKLFIDEETFVITKNTVAMIPAYVKSFEVIDADTLFIVKEKSEDLESMYK